MNRPATRLLSSSVRFSTICCDGRGTVPPVFRLQYNQLWQVIRTGTLHSGDTVYRWLPWSKSLSRKLLLYEFGVLVLKVSVLKPQALKPLVSVLVVDDNITELSARGGQCV
jgi:hypothetical protein